MSLASCSVTAAALNADAVVIVIASVDASETEKLQMLVQQVRRWKQLVHESETISATTAVAEEKQAMHARL